MSNDWSSIFNRRTLHTDKTFKFMPSFKKKQVKKEIWVMGETYAMEITLRNPLPSDVVVNQLEVLHNDASLTCVGARQIVIPANASITTHVYLIPGSVGELTLMGIRVLFEKSFQSRFAWVMSGVISIQHTMSL